MPPQELTFGDWNSDTATSTDIDIQGDTFTLAPVIPDSEVYLHDDWGDNKLQNRDESGTTATPPVKILKSEQGMMVALDDDGQTITVSDEDGRNMLQISVQSGQVTLQGTTKVVVEAPAIELVERATHPVVHGDRLTQYLNQIVQLYQSHTHPGQMAAGVLPVTPAPPVPPLTPPTPDLLSTKVKSG